MLLKWSVKVFQSVIPDSGKTFRSTSIFWIELESGKEGAIVRSAAEVTNDFQNKNKTPNSNIQYNKGTYEMDLKNAWKAIEESSQGKSGVTFGAMMPGHHYRFP